MTRASGRVRPVPLYVGALLVLQGAALMPAAPAHAQSVRGRVIDAASSGPLRGVQLRLLDEGDEAVAQTLSDSAGAFYLATRSGGAFRIEARLIGYRTTRTDTLRFAFRETAEVVVRMSTTAVPLDPLTVTARRRDERHYATYSGLYARRETSPAVGPRRIVLRDDPEMKDASSVGDVLNWFGGTGCITVYWNGHMQTNIEVLDWYPARELEGIEFYRRDIDAPLEMRQRRADCDDGNARLGTIIALWARRPDGWRADREPPEAAPTLPATPPLRMEATYLEAAGTLRGRVEAPPGYDVGGVVVELVGGRGERFGAVRADDRGAFELRAPGPGSYHIRVLHRDLGAATSEPLELAAGQGAELVLRLGGAHLPVP